MARRGQPQINIHVHYRGDQTETTHFSNVTNIHDSEIANLSAGAGQVPQEAPPEINEEVIEENEQPNLAADSSKSAKPSKSSSSSDFSSSLGKMKLSDQHVDNYFAEEEAEALMKDSKFKEAIDLLEPLPQTQGQQMKLMECYFELKRDAKVLKCIEKIKKLVAGNPRSKGIAVYNLGLAYFKKSSNIKAMIFFACAAKIYLLQSNADESVRGIGNCSFQCNQVIKAMIKQNERTRNFACDVGMELMNGFADDAMRVENSNPDIKTDMVAHCLTYTGFCYDDLKNYQMAIECYKRGIDIMNRQFGENSSKYEVFGDLLNNMGFANSNLGNYSEADTWYKRSNDAYKRVEDWINDEQKKKSIERTENNLRIVRDKMKK